MRGSMEALVEAYFGDLGLPLPDEGLPPDPDWAFLDSVGPSAPDEEAPELLAPIDAVGSEIGAALEARHVGNRAAAAELAALTAALGTAGRYPSSYLLPHGLTEPDAAELAIRAAAFDAGLQLDLTTNQVRILAYQGQVLQQQLPQLWQQFRLGLTSYAHAQAAVQNLTGLTDPAAIQQYDSVLTGKAAGLTPALFRQTARTLRDRLLAEPATQRHERASQERRVWVEPAEDGMAWLHLYAAAPDIIRVQARLDATAKNTARREASAPAEACRRTRPQIRADLAVAWLAGDGTPTAAKVRPLLLVPLLSLLGQSEQPAILHGYGPVDPGSAARLFAAAPAFRRAGTDPIRGEMLNLGRDKYRPTKAQRQWLTAKYGTCACPNCTAPAATADIDHLQEWVRDHGPSNIDNLIPLCPPMHRLKTLSKIRFDKAPAADGADEITVTTPTGHRARRTVSHYGDDPPF